MTPLLAEATELLYREASLLDERLWDDWVALYTLDCEYWVPTWKNEDEPTADPKRELSLIYYSNRAGLEDRAWRVNSGRAASSAVLPRTQHVITHIRIAQSSEDARIWVKSNWTVQQFLPKEKVVETFFGRYEHALVRSGAEWRIAKKKILLLNDYLPAKIDFYNL